MERILRGTVVTESSIIDDGVVVFSDDDGGSISFVGPDDGGLASAGAVGDLPAQSDQLILPGLVDIHNHGGGGASFPDALDAEAVRVGALEHLRHGTTTLIASAVTAAPDVLLARADLFADMAEAGVIAGMHCEGPFLSLGRRGAQSPDYLRDGDPSFVRELAGAARGWLRTMTVAPEIPGVAGPGGAAEALVECGVIPSLGHTSCTEEQAEAFINQVCALLAGSGRTMTVTHLFNGMAPLHHRDPGPVAACLAAAAAGRIVAELVADGVHLAPATIRSMSALMGNGNVAYVTDAMAAAGMADGAYQLGPMAVVVSGGVARLATADGSEGAIAGGTAHLIDELRVALAAGVPLVDAVRSASATPARALGLAGVGSIAPGNQADLLVTTPTLDIRQVIKHGHPVT